MQLKVEILLWLKGVVVKELTLSGQVSVPWHAENILLNLNPGDFNPRWSEFEFHCYVCVAPCSASSDCL